MFVCLQLRSAGSSSTKVFVIDEIGKMELFSQSFIRAVRQTLDSPYVVLGTIPVPKGRPLGLVEEVRSRRDVKVFHVSKNQSVNISGTLAIGQCLHSICCLEDRRAMTPHYLPAFEGLSVNHA